MSDARVNIWLEELRGCAGEPPAEGLARVFGITEAQAVRVLRKLPRVVKRDAAPAQARQLCDALRTIGGRVRIERAAGAGLSSRPPEPLVPTSVPASVRPGATPAAASAASSEGAALAALPLAAASRRAESAEVGISVPPPADWTHLPSRVDTGEVPGVSELAGIVPLAAPVSEYPLTAAPRPLATSPAALALPEQDRPAAPVAMRPPEARAVDPRPRAQLAVGPAAGRAGAGNPVAVALDVLREAERSSWREALHGHPVFGFLLVLGTTTSAALLLYAMF